MGIAYLAEQNIAIQIERIELLAPGLDSRVVEAFSAAESKHFQFGLDWLTNLATYALQDFEEAVLYIARDSSGDFLALPMKINRVRHEVHALTNFYTAAYSPVIQCASPNALLVALFDHLKKNEGFKSLSLSPIATNPNPPIEVQKMSEQLTSALTASSWRGIHRYFCFGNWCHELRNTTYNEYVSSLSSRVRNTVGRRSRKFLESSGGDLELVTSGDRLETAIREFVAVYNSSWKKPEPHTDFIPQLLHLCARRGWLRLGIAHYDNEPVASQIWLVNAGTAYIFKLAYHESYKHLSPGTVLTAFMMKRVIDGDGVLRINYLSGDDAYKKDWMSVRHEFAGIAAFNTGTIGGAGQWLVHCAKRAIKSLIHRASNKKNLE